MIDFYCRLLRIARALTAYAYKKANKGTKNILYLQIFHQKKAKIACKMKNPQRFIPKRLQIFNFFCTFAFAKCADSSA